GRGERPHVALPLAALARHMHARDDRVLVHVQAGTSFVDAFHGRPLQWACVGRRRMNEESDLRATREAGATVRGAWTRPGHSIRELEAPYRAAGLRPRTPRAQSSHFHGPWRPRRHGH